MPKSFPQVLMGQCPICTGGGAGPDTDAGSAFSTTQIEAREDVTLEYSPYYDTEVCVLHQRIGREEKVDNVKFSERDRQAERDRQRFGFVKTYTPQS